MKRNVLQNQKIAACLASFALAGAAGAAITPLTFTTSGAANTSGAESTYNANIASDDLIDNATGIATLTADQTEFFGDNGDLTDGAGSPGTSDVAYLPEAFEGGRLPATFTYDLDVSVNTLGYNITEINSFAGWVENGAQLSNQQYEVLVSTVGDAGFSSLYTVSYIPYTTGDGTGTDAAATWVNLTDDSGILASGVDAIRFVFSGHGQSGDNIVDGTVYSEIDVIGTPVPEPGSLALMSLGGLCVLRRRRHKN